MLIDERRLLLCLESFTIVVKLFNYTSQDRITRQITFSCALKKEWLFESLIQNSLAPNIRLTNQHILTSTLVNSLKTKAIFNTVKFQAINCIFVLFDTAI